MGLLNVFKNWLIPELKEMALDIYSLSYNKDDSNYHVIIVVYSVGSNDKRVYIVIKGKFMAGIPFNLHSYAKYPTGNENWELLVMTRNMLKDNEIYNIGAIFGQLEVGSNSLRKTEVKAITRSKVYYLDWSTYIKCKW